MVESNKDTIEETRHNSSAILPTVFYYLPVIIISLYYIQWIMAVIGGDDFGIIVGGFVLLFLSVILLFVQYIIYHQVDRVKLHIFVIDINKSWIVLFYIINIVVAMLRTGVLPLL